MDNLQYQEVLIDQYIKIMLEKCLESPKTTEIVRLPFSIYMHCRGIFKRESQVITCLLKKIRQMFYLKEFSFTKENSSDLANNIYVRLLLAANNNKVIYLSQIVVRIVLLALSLKMGQKDTQTFKCKFRELLNSLKIQLVLSSNESISDLIIAELQVMSECLQSLQFYEQLKKFFQKFDVFKVVKWIEGALKQKRDKFQAKSRQTLPFKCQQSKKKEINQTKRLQYCQLPQIKQQKKQIKFDNSNSIVSKDKTVINNRRSNSPKKQRHVSSIHLAAKMRKSMCVAPMRFSSKYIFKSSKKETQETKIIYQQQSEIDFDSINREKEYREQLNKPENVIVRPQINEKQQNSRVLCPATPPRRAINHNRK